VIKLFFVLRRRPDVTPEQFHDYWKNTHGPLVAQVPGLVRYVQHHTMSIPRPEYASDDPPIDGVVETLVGIDGGRRASQPQSGIRSGHG
jgi:uncharacterized protein (TIGR02118 family)